MFQKLLQNENKQFPPKLRLDALPFTIHIALSKTIKVHPYKSSIIYYLNPRNELKDLDGFKWYKSQTPSRASKWLNVYSLGAQ